VIFVFSLQFAFRNYQQINQQIQYEETFETSEIRLNLLPLIILISKFQGFDEPGFGCQSFEVVLADSTTNGNKYVFGCRAIRGGEKGTKDQLRF
jgi:hypothetical protein